MFPENKNDPKDDESGDATGGGQTGKVAMRVALMVGDSRDEPRTPAERRHLAAVHAATLADRIRRAMERQKGLATTREQSPGRLNERQPHTAGMGSGDGQVSPYKSHPISETAYFSGAEESPVPSENQQDLNQEDREKLEARPENSLQNRPSLQQAPKYSPPKLRPY